MKKIKFIFTGGVSATVSIAGLHLLSGVLGMWYLPASVLAFCVAVVVNFTLQYFFVFRVGADGAMASRFLQFFVLTMVNLCLNTLFMYVSVEYLSLHYLVGQVLVTATLTVLNYVICERIFTGTLFLRKGR